LTTAQKFPTLRVVKNSATVFIALLLTASSGCNKGPDAKDDSPAAVQTEAAKIFIMRCAMCHGPTGAGSGSAAANLSPKPRNLQDSAWQDSVDDAYIEKIIKLGGLGVGKSAAMPPNPDIADNEPVVKALVTKVRSLRK
jgi:mono/diheme cytochrome c family protein